MADKTIDVHLNASMSGLDVSIKKALRPIEEVMNKLNSSAFGGNDRVSSLMTTLKGAKHFRSILGNEGIGLSQADIDRLAGQMEALVRVRTSLEDAIREKDITRAADAYKQFMTHLDDFGKTMHSTLGGVSTTLQAELRDIQNVTRNLDFGSIQVAKGRKTVDTKTLEADILAHRNALLDITDKTSKAHAVLSQYLNTNDFNNIVTQAKTALDELDRLTLTKSGTLRQRIDAQSIHNYNNKYRQGLKAIYTLERTFVERLDNLAVMTDSLIDPLTAGLPAGMNTPAAAGAAALIRGEDEAMKVSRRNHNRQDAFFKALTGLQWDASPDNVRLFQDFQRVYGAFIDDFNAQLKNVFSNIIGGLGAAAVFIAIQSVSQTARDIKQLTNQMLVYENLLNGSGEKKKAAAIKEMRGEIESLSAVTGKTLEELGDLYNQLQRRDISTDGLAELLRTAQASYTTYGTDVSQVLSNTARNYTDMQRRGVSVQFYADLIDFGGPLANETVEAFNKLIQTNALLTMSYEDLAIVAKYYAETGYEVSNSVAENQAVLAKYRTEVQRMAEGHLTQNKPIWYDLFLGDPSDISRLQTELGRSIQQTWRNVLENIGVGGGSTVFATLQTQLLGVLGILETITGVFKWLSEVPGVNFVLNLVQSVATLAALNVGLKIGGKLFEVLINNAKGLVVQGELLSKIIAHVFNFKPANEAAKSVQNLTLAWNETGKAGATAMGKLSNSVKGLAGPLRTIGVLLRGMLPMMLVSLAITGIGMAVNHFRNRAQQAKDAESFGGKHVSDYTQEDLARFAGARNVLQSRDPTQRAILTNFSGSTILGSEAQKMLNAVGVLRDLEANAGDIQAAYEYWAAAHDEALGTLQRFVDEGLMSPEQMETFVELALKSWESEEAFNAALARETENLTSTIEPSPETDPRRVAGAVFDATRSLFHSTQNLYVAEQVRDDIIALLNEEGQNLELEVLDDVEQILNQARQVADDIFDLNTGPHSFASRFEEGRGRHEKRIETFDTSVRQLIESGYTGTAREEMLEALNEAIIAERDAILDLRVQEENEMYALTTDTIATMSDGTAKLVASIDSQRRHLENLRDIYEQEKAMGASPEALRQLEMQLQRGENDLIHSQRALLAWRIDLERTFQDTREGINDIIQPLARFASDSQTSVAQLYQAVIDVLRNLDENPEMASAQRRAALMALRANLPIALEYDKEKRLVDNLLRRVRSSDFEAKEMRNLIEGIQNLEVNSQAGTRYFVEQVYEYVKGEGIDGLQRTRDAMEDAFKSLHSLVEPENPYDYQSGKDALYNATLELGTFIANQHNLIQALNWVKANQNNITNEQLTGLREELRFEQARLARTEQLIRETTDEVKLSDLKAQANTSRERIGVLEQEIAQMQHLLTMSNEEIEEYVAELQQALADNSESVTRYAQNLVTAYNELLGRLLEEARNKVEEQSDKWKNVGLETRSAEQIHQDTLAEIDADAAKLKEELGEPLLQAALALRSGFSEAWAKVADFLPEGIAEGPVGAVLQAFDTLIDEDIYNPDSWFARLFFPEQAKLLAEVDADAAAAKSRQEAQRQKERIEEAEREYEEAFRRWANSSVEERDEAREALSEAAQALQVALDGATLLIDSEHENYRSIWAEIQERSTERSEQFNEQLRAFAREDFQSELDRLFNTLDVATAAEGGSEVALSRLAGEDAATVFMNAVNRIFAMLASETASGLLDEDEVYDMLMRGEGSLANIGKFIDESWIRDPSKLQQAFQDWGLSPQSIAYLMGNVIDNIAEDVLTKTLEDASDNLESIKLGEEGALADFKTALGESRTLGIDTQAIVARLRELGVTFDEDSPLIRLLDGWNLNLTERYAQAVLAEAERLSRVEPEYGESPEEYARRTAEAAQALFDLAAAEPNVPLKEYTTGMLFSLEEALRDVIANAPADALTEDVMAIVGPYLEGFDESIVAAMAERLSPENRQRYTERLRQQAENLRTQAGDIEARLGQEDLNAMEIVSLLMRVRGLYTEAIALDLKAIEEDIKANEGNTAYQDELRLKAVELREQFGTTIQGLVESAVEALKGQEGELPTQLLLNELGNLEEFVASTEALLLADADGLSEDVKSFLQTLFAALRALISDAEQDIAKELDKTLSNILLDESLTPEQRALKQRITRFNDEDRTGIDWLEGVQDIVSEAGQVKFRSVREQLGNTPNADARAAARTIDYLDMLIRDPELLGIHLSTEQQEQIRVFLRDTRKDFEAMLLTPANMLKSIMDGLLNSLHNAMAGFFKDVINIPRRMLEEQQQREQELHDLEFQKRVNEQRLSDYERLRQEAVETYGLASEQVEKYNEKIVEARAKHEELSEAIRKNREDAKNFFDYMFDAINRFVDAMLDAFAELAAQQMAAAVFNLFSGGEVGDTGGGGGDTGGGGGDTGKVDSTQNSSVPSVDVGEAAQNIVGTGVNSLVMGGTLAGAVSTMGTTAAIMVAATVVSGLLSEAQRLIEEYSELEQDKARDGENRFRDNDDIYNPIDRNNPRVQVTIKGNLNAQRLARETSQKVFDAVGKSLID